MHISDWSSDVCSSDLHLKSSCARVPAMTDAHLDQFRTFAAYNRWANGRLYDACAALPETEYRRPRGAFFGSLHGTLNHLLVADRIWLGRIEGVDPGLARLDAILHAAFAALRAARAAEDARIAALVDLLDPARLPADLHSARPEERRVGTT